MGKGKEVNMWLYVFVMKLQMIISWFDQMQTKYYIIIKLY